MDFQAPLEWGRPEPLGASQEKSGVNFAVFATGALGVELCLNAASTGGGEVRLPLPERTGDVWHGFLPHSHPAAGLLSHGYGFCVRRSGGDTPRLLDPYARTVSGPEEAVLNESGNVGTLQAPWGLLPPAPPTPQHPRPKTPLEQTVIYEAHVRGLTMLHPDVPEELRGTYAGLAHPAVTGYLRDLGITAVELLPVHAHADDIFLREKGLSNYWGYSSLSFFAPEPRYSAAMRRGAPAETEAEFAGMVEALHAAGLEVILDVVYNHTAEGGADGPTLSWRGFAEETYYLRGAAGEYLNPTGTGNALRMGQRQSVQLVLDSLRHWAALGVDGFRFDLAATLTRGECAGLETGPNLHGPLLAAIQADPVLRGLKLIAEPWDIGAGGYLLGQFPAPWLEWNDRYRDDVRGFWRGDAGAVGALASRLTGSSDVFAPAHRGPLAGVNFVTAHDGFTLRDLVSYTQKHNEANGEGNRDGHGHNLSQNFGVEGETDDPDVLAARARMQRNLLATLLLSQGVPMLLGGDEAGRTQRGNNNAYAQDNAVTWHDWVNIDTGLLNFTRRLIALRQATPLLHQRRFFAEQLQGLDGEDTSRAHASWWRFDGERMTQGDWQGPQTQSLGLWLSHGAEGVFIMLNASPIGLPFQLPPEGEWTLLLDTTELDTTEGSAAGTRSGGAACDLAAGSLQVWQRVLDKEG